MLKKIVCLLLVSLTAQAATNDTIQSLSGSAMPDPEDGIRLLKKCSAIECQLYKIYFLHFTNPKQASLTYQNLLRTNKKISELDRKYSDIYLQDASNNADNLKNRIAYILTTQEENKYIYIPEWLAIDQPHIIYNLCDNVQLMVANGNAFLHYELRKFYLTLYSLDGGVWNNTRYIAGIDSKAIIANDACNWQMIYYAPQLYLKDLLTVPSIDSTLRLFYIWSFHGIWNRIMYQEIIKMFVDASDILQQHYQGIDSIRKYAPFAKEILALYIAQRCPKSALSNNAAFQVFNVPNKSVLTLQKEVKGFTQSDWNTALKVAILNEYNPETISWIIKQGANVNAITMDETPLMAAIKAPEIVRMLIRHGAEIDAPNRFGKTAIFYAIQFNALESLKVMIESGANINAQIKSLQELEALHHESLLYKLDQVAGFTPLVYALRYSPKDTVEFLVSKGAKLPMLISRQDIENWVYSAEDNKISRDEIKLLLDKSAHH